MRSPPAATSAGNIFFDEGGHSSTAGAYIGGVDLGYNFQFGHFVVGPVIGFSGSATQWAQRQFARNWVVVYSVS